VTGQDVWRNEVKFYVTQKERNSQFTPEDNMQKCLRVQFTTNHFQRATQGRVWFSEPVFSIGKKGRPYKNVT